MLPGEPSCRCSCVASLPASPVKDCQNLVAPRSHGRSLGGPCVGDGVVGPEPSSGSCKPPSCRLPALLLRMSFDFFRGFVRRSGQASFPNAHKCGTPHLKAIVPAPMGGLSCPPRRLCSPTACTVPTGGPLSLVFVKSFCEPPPAPCRRKMCEARYPPRKLTPSWRILGRSFLSTRVDNAVFWGM